MLHPAVPADLPSRDGPSAGRPAGPGVDCRGRWLSLARPVVMGILNVTPDSFSDGGAYASVQAAVDRAAQMAGEGAAVVDIGGESTRPAGAAYGAGARALSLDEELSRVLPVVEAVARAVPHVLISVDTYKGAVAREALRAGAHLVNDVTGLAQGVDTARAAAEYGAPLVVMHGAGTPGAMPHEWPADANTPDADLVAVVTQALAEKVALAESLGVRDVIVDPGFGFGKAPTDNLRLVAAVDRLADATGRPVLVGVSRKRTVGMALGRPDAPPGDRLYGSLALAALAAARGAAIVRTHDVAATADVLRVVAEVMAAEAAAGTAT